VGNIPTGIAEVEIMEFFNTAMAAAKAITKPGNPIIAVQINVEKSYAFLELRSAEEATAGMVFDGIMLHGHALKVRRPKDYIPLPGTPENQQSKPALPAGAIVATNVPDSPYKIFVGGLPAHLTEEQVKELLMTFGPLKAFNLVKDTATGLSKGFAFCEYLDDSVTDRACAGLNGMKLGDKQLLVQRASIGAKHPTPPLMPTPVPITAAALTGPLTATPANILNLSIPAVTLLGSLMNLQATGEPTRVLQLLNLITYDELRDDFDYEAVKQDVREECGKIGPVREVTIPRPPANALSNAKSVSSPLTSPNPNSPTPFMGMPNSPTERDGDTNSTIATSATPDPTEISSPSVPQPQAPAQRVCPIAKIYVVFERQEDCAKALHALAGRRYGGHIVVTSLYSEEKYNANQLQ
jgi:splicing factor U2AF subunit